MLPRRTTPISFLIIHYWALDQAANMLSFITQASLALFLAHPILGQAGNRFVSQIPKEEVVALSNIVEDDPNSLPAGRSGGDEESPAYTLYSVTLPIPPVAQVKQ
jgi:hypothetical protein